MKNISKIVYSFILFASVVYTQVMPDYKERSILRSRDSLNNINSLYTATDGAINPDEYKIGPGDRFFISIRGLEENQINAAVNYEGVLYLPRIGSVDINNLVLKEAKQKIEKFIRKYFKDIDVFVSLTEFRKIKVSLLGDVKLPSAFVLSGNSRLMDIINISNGLNLSANIRHIKIISSGGAVKYYDLLSFLRYANNDNNPYLNTGDIVVVEKSDVTVSIYGKIKSPGAYEYLENEPVADLIEIAGGLYDNAVTDSIEIIKFNADNKTQSSYFYSYDELKTKKIILSKRDKVVVREKPDYMLDKTVLVNGFVKYPGLYKIIENKTTLKDVLLLTGGFRENASLKDATITRAIGTEDVDPEFERLKNVPRNEMTDDEYDYLKAKSRQRKGRVIVDMEALMLKNDNKEAVLLKHGDVINIPEAKNYVILLGQVVNPGNVVYTNGWNYKEYLNMAGGFGWRASKGDVRIIKANTGEWVDANESVEIKPGDTIWVPEDPPGPKFWTVATTVLTVIGQVATVVAATVAVIVATR